MDLEQQKQWISNHTLYLLPFDEEQIWEYLRKAVSKAASSYFDKIIKIYDLEDLSKRPILLSLIVNILPKLDKRKVITQDSIYETTVRLWLDREAWRGLDTEEMLTFMEDLATSMFIKRVLTMNFKDLSEEVRSQLQHKIISWIDLEYFDSLIRTSGFLYRDTEGNFSFMHRSFLEYFFARALRKRVQAGKLTILENNDLPREDYYGISIDEEDEEGDKQYRIKLRTEYEKKKEKALLAINDKLQTHSDEVYQVSDGIVELLASALAVRFRKHNITSMLRSFVQKRRKFREDERVLWKFGFSLTWRERS